MNVQGKSIAASGIAVGAIAVVIAGVFAFGATQREFSPEPGQTESVVVQPSIDQVDAGDQALGEAEAARIEAERIEAERIAAEAEAERVAAEAAAAAQAAADAEAARIAAEQAAAAQEQPAPGAGTAPSGPIKCPAGSSANSGDGQNDTSCLPDICFHIALPDAAHPECDVAFRP